jgi:hypothetical protein
VAELAAAPAADGTPDVKTKISEPVGRHSVDGSGPLEIEEEGRV